MSLDIVKCPLKDKFIAVENCWARGQCNDYVYHNLWLYMVAFMPINSVRREKGKLPVLSHIELTEENTID